jgi:hypothetical protein
VPADQVFNIFARHASSAPTRYPDNSPARSRQHAARLRRAIVANDQHHLTACGQAATADVSLPLRVHAAIDQRAAAILKRGKEYERWRAAAPMIVPPTAMRGASIAVIQSTVQSLTVSKLAEQG